MQFGSEQRTGSSGVNRVRTPWSQPGCRASQTPEGSWDRDQAMETLQRWALLRAGGVSLQQGGALLRVRHCTSSRGWGQTLLMAALGPGSPRKCQLQAPGPGWAVQEAGAPESFSANDQGQPDKEETGVGGRGRGDENRVGPGWCAFLSAAT